jgi:acyl carrier protein
MNEGDVAEVKAMKTRVQRLVYIAAGGKISEVDLTVGTTDLRTIGLDSLGYLNLLEGLERTFGVAIDLDREPDHTFLHTIDNIVGYLKARQCEAA